MNETQTIRSTTHLYVKTTNNTHFLLSSLHSRSDTQLIEIDSATGCLCYDAIQDVDLFGSEEQALLAIENKNCKIDHQIRAEGIIGCATFGSTFFLVLIKKSEKSPVLFGGHVIKRIDSVEWIKINLTYLSPPNEKQKRNLDRFFSTPIEGLHFYCETLDLTRKFPSSHQVHDYIPEFCFNGFLSEPFQKLGLRSWCIVLLQGLAIGKRIAANIVHMDKPKEKEQRKKIKSPNKNEIGIFLITRKTNLNPGTRYYARGLNERGEPGNEMECELFILKYRSTSIHYVSTIFRRGTVPVNWETKLKSNVSLAPDLVIKKDPYKNAEKYFSRLAGEFGKHPITCFNLLKCDIESHEVVLIEKYQQCVKYAQKFIKNKIKLINFDWHKNTKTFGLEMAVEGLWLQLIEILKKQDLNEEIFQVYKCPENNDLWAIYENTKSQSGVVRFNCADSLDRTNVCTFFVSIQIITEMCYRLGLGLNLKKTFHNDQSQSQTQSDNGGGGGDDDDYNQNESGNKRKGKRKQRKKRKKKDKEKFEKWKFFKSSFSNVIKLLNTDILSTLAEFFVSNGDIISMLYTNSPALYTSLIREYNPELKKITPSSNTKITLQRRYQNVKKDKFRQIQYEMFLGLNLGKHLNQTASQLIQRVLLSNYPSWCLTDIVSDQILPKIGKNKIIQDKCERLIFEQNLCWVTPSIKNKDVQIWLYLSKPSIITEIAITVREQYNNAVIPMYVDIYIGNQIDTLKLVFKKIQMPRTVDGTILYFDLSKMNYLLNPELMFNYNENCENIRLFSKIVLLKFYNIETNNKFLTSSIKNFEKIALGLIQVFGVPIESNKQLYYDFENKSKKN